MDRLKLVGEMHDTADLFEAGMLREDALSVVSNISPWQWLVKVLHGILSLSV